jgi:ThiF family protein
MRHLIIGSGGITSWLVPLLKHTLPNEDEVTIADGDQLEPKNLDRQMFSVDHLGWNKAQALAQVHGTAFYPAYMTPGCDLITGDINQFSFIWCAADNHPARKYTLELADQLVARWAIIGGNEYTDSEAYAYTNAWQGTAGDPRVYYPEILEDKTGDPLSPWACQGTAQVANRQLALANYLAAGYMVHLFWFLTNSASEVEHDHWPVRHWNNFAMFNSKPYGP